MLLHEKVIQLLREAKADGEYHNVHVVKGLLEMLHEVKNFDDEELNDWYMGLWEM